MPVQIEAKTVTRLCNENTIITVNGQLPGPTIYVHDGDTVIVETYNKAEYNATLHWYIVSATLIIKFQNIMMLLWTSLMILIMRVTVTYCQAWSGAVAYTMG